MTESGAANGQTRVTKSAVEKLPVAELPPRKHRWNYDKERRLDGSEFKDGNARTERTCIFCGLTKVTVHPPSGFAWREWMSPKSPERFQCESTPACIAEEAP